MDMPMIISQVAVLFILMGIGYAAGKAKVLTAEGNQILTKLVLGIAMPSMVLNAVISGGIEGTMGDVALFVPIMLLWFAIAHIIALPAAYALGGNKADRGLHGYIGAYANLGFMGFPVAYAIFGPEATFYVALLNVPITMLIFSVGVILIAGKGNKIDFKILLNPTLIMALVALLIFATGVRLPAVVTEVLRVTGGMTTPGSMLVLGASLSMVPVKDVFNNWRLYPIALVKLIVIPVVTWLVFRRIITNEFLLGLLVIMSGLPTGAMAVILSTRYGGNERTASSGVFLTTLLSAVTIPLLAFLLLT